MTIEDLVELFDMDSGGSIDYKEFIILMSNIIKLILEIELKNRGIMKEIAKNVNFSLDMSVYTDYEILALNKYR